MLGLKPSSLTHDQQSFSASTITAVYPVRTLGEVLPFQQFDTVTISQDGNTILSGLVSSIETDPEDSPSTVIVFCDASSRPYYSFSGEWTMGMDWVLEELVIAAERKPVIQKILQSLDRQPGKNPDFRLIGQLFLSMPDGIEQFHASYRNWMEETLKNDGEDSSGLKKRARRIEQMNQLLSELLKIISNAENMEQLQSFLQPYQTRLNASPVVKQFLESYLAVEPYIHPLKKDPSFLDSFLQEPVEKVQARIISISPHSKMSRYLRTHAWDNIRMGAEIFKLDDTYKNNPSLALQRLEKSFSKYTSYASRQLLLLLKGRFFAEQGEWDKARQALNQAIPMDPLSGNAGEAKKLLQSLSSNRVRLQELFYLKRRGNQEIDDEWDKLLLIETSGNVFFNFSTFDEYFN